jgi:hypothetical protein
MTRSSNRKSLHIIQDGVCAVLLCFVLGLSFVNGFHAVKSPLHLPHIRNMPIRTSSVVTLKIMRYNRSPPAWKSTWRGTVAGDTFLPSDEVAGDTFLPSDEEESDDKQEIIVVKKEKSQVPAVTFNLMKAMVGSGVLALPAGVAAMSDHRTA